MRALFQPAALEEFRQAIIWYGEVAGQRPAEALDREINAKLELLKDHPLIGTPGIGRSRWIPLKRFPYTLHYRVVGEVIDILAVAHQRRRPGYWRKR
jgi:plasmid stabilization system protein ParE